MFVVNTLLQCLFERKFISGIFYMKAMGEGGEFADVKLQKSLYWTHYIGVSHTEVRFGYRPPGSEDEVIKQVQI
jgi:hypothetical protein